MVDTAQEMPSFALHNHIQAGDNAPWWKQGSHKFLFDRAAGRYIVLCFYGSARDDIGQATLRAIDDTVPRLPQDKVSFFFICASPGDKTEHDVARGYPALQFVWDLDAAVHRAYGIGARMWVVLDPMLRVVEVLPFRKDRADMSRLLNLLPSLLTPSVDLGQEAPIPVLMLPNVFEPELCRHLINCFEANGGRESGFMQEIGGKAVEQYDPEWKRRRDFHIRDESLIGAIKVRIARRVGEALRKSFQFTFSRMERYLIACYSADDGGHFGPHRDDTVKATEHRRFALSISLNTEFDGGGVSFPEFSARQFKAPLGGAIAFSCSLLHQVARVTCGRRYAFLPFLYDEAAERIRLANLRNI
jgi:predicted 2-oxoglutarate/Fe(II)-dependent dioxygenase YbiX